VIWPVRALVLVGLLCVVLYSDADAEAIAAGGVVVTFAGLELMHAARYRRVDHQAQIWHRRWKEEHDNFQQWIRAELNREGKRRNEG
jgi:hypothetical protein